MEKNYCITCAVLIIALFFLAGCSNVMDPNESGNLVPETVAEDPLLSSIEVNGTSLHAEAFGDIQNSIIVFLHGGPGSDYRALISQIGVENASRYPNQRTINNGGLSQLQDEYYCVFYDQRGAGLSPRFDKGRVNFNLYLEDLDAVIEYYLDKKENETGIVDDQVCLVGWSYGGYLSTGYINKFPEKIKDVVLYESGPFIKKAMDYFMENTSSVFSQMGKDWLEGFLLSHDHMTADDHERSDYQYLLGAFRSNPQFHEHPDCPLWRIGSLIWNEDLEDDRDITSNLVNFQGNMLFLCGELTENEYPDYSGLQMPFYPQGEFVEIPGVGHTGPWEKSNEIASIIRDFLAQ